GSELPPPSRSPRHASLGPESSPDRALEASHGEGGRQRGPRRGTGRRRGRQGRTEEQAGAGRGDLGVRRGRGGQGAAPRHLQGALGDDGRGARAVERPRLRSERVLLPTLPVWGSLMQFYSPRELMTFGCVLWGLATLLLAAASSYEVHLALRLVAGAALASVAPVGRQALICDVVPEEGRGWAFGLLQSVSSALTMVVSFWTTSIATSTVLGLQGWRVPHLLVAVLSFLTGAAVWQVVPQVAPVKAQRSWLAEQRRVVSAVVRKPSFVIMVSQGVTGSIPWNAFAFLTFFWQVSGYSDMEAGEISLMMGLGGVVGGMLGGWLGDSCARISPYSGRCAVAQASVLLGTISFLGLVHVPQGRYSFSLVSALSFTFGAVASWTPAAALRPISGALFEDSQDRAQVLALWIAVEGVVASICGAPLVGLLSEAFGFKLSHGHGASAQLPEDRAGSLRALRAALVGTSVVPWTLCFLAWVPMYWTPDLPEGPPAEPGRAAAAASTSGWGAEGAAFFSRHRSGVGPAMQQGAEALPTVHHLSVAHRLPLPHLSGPQRSPGAPPPRRPPPPP
ncbi:unnamed protein product, partial [Prorocentrum cordatum]